MTSSSTLFTQPKAAAASPRTEACGFHPDRRSDSLSSTVHVSNLHLQFANIFEFDKLEFAVIYADDGISGTNTKNVRTLTV